MGKRKHGSGDARSEQERLAHIARQNQLLHRSVFAHLTRLVADPDRPGAQITFGELDLRLRGRAYRQAVQVSRRRAHPAPDAADSSPEDRTGAVALGG